MSDFKSLGAFASHIATQVVRGGAAIPGVLYEAGKSVEKEAKREIGAYQEEVGPFAAWAELSDATKDDRSREGYSEDKPLLRTGDMRASISTSLSPTGLEVQVGSGSDTAVYQELGTAHIPPRSFLGGAMARRLPEIKRAVGPVVVAALVGEGVHNRRLDID